MSFCDLRCVAIEVTSSQSRHNEISTPARSPEESDAGGAGGAGTRVTREVGIRELKHRTSEVIDRVARGDRVAVTRRGHIVAVILSLEESLEFVLGYAEEFTLARAEAQASTEAGE
jgi:prevent-host-death family protein